MLKSIPSADMAQSVAHLIGSEEVMGSIPVVSTDIGIFSNL